MQRSLRQPYWHDDDLVEARPSLAAGIKRDHQAAERIPKDLSRSAPIGTWRNRWWSSAGYALLGFVLGAVFWHFVGFWDFVGQIVFRGKVTGVEITQAPPPIKLRERVSGVSALEVVLSPETCTTLQLDRSSGLIAAMSCDSQALPLRSLKAARREDLWVTATQRLVESSAKGWAAVRVEAPIAYADQASAD